MFFHRWDPGIVGEVGQGIEFHHGKNKGILRRGSLSNLRGSDVGLGERIQGVLRKLGICASWIWILLINTKESYDYTGSVAGQQWGCEGWRRHAEKDEDFSAAL
ncbi:hypothetical protein Bca4012_099614 [Brassica carinata]